MTNRNHFLLLKIALAGLFVVLAGRSMLRPGTAYAYTTYATATTTVQATFLAGTITPVSTFTFYQAHHSFALSTGGNTYRFSVKDGSTEIASTSVYCGANTCSIDSSSAAHPVLIAGHVYNYTLTYFSGPGTLGASGGTYGTYLNGNLLSDASYLAKLKPLHPLNGYTLPQMFNFQAIASSTLSGSAYTVEINYTSPTNAFLWTDDLSLTATGNTTQFTIPPSAPQFGIVGQNVTWTATATLSYAGTLLDTVGSTWTIGATTSTIPDATCGITDVPCAMSKLFAPSQASFQQFSNLAATYGKKPPFGYMASLATALGGLQNATSATTSIVLMSSSTATVFNNFFSPLDIGLAGALFVLALLWGIRRFKDFYP